MIFWRNEKPSIFSTKRNLPILVSAPVTSIIVSVVVKFRSPFFQINRLLTPPLFLPSASVLPSLSLPVQCTSLKNILSKFKRPFIENAQKLNTTSFFFVTIDKYRSIFIVVLCCCYHLLCVLMLWWSFTRKFNEYRRITLFICHSLIVFSSSFTKLYNVLWL